ncbi:hypothetical protein, partial [Paraburkholderia caribensis]|uniref:hypothetical protein n=1 Tax=Paraburkholderia caribensis TaxID=75105 RepID=UPI0020918872
MIDGPVAVVGFAARAVFVCGGGEGRGAGFGSGLLVFSLASAMRYLASRVAPVRGGTYFSL